MSTAQPWVVRIRAQGYCWTSLPMPEGDARTQRDDLRDQVDRIDRGRGFVSFRGTLGREAEIRARDVVAVEAMPWIERNDEPAPARAPARTGTTATVTVYGAAGPQPASGTTYLRQVAAHQGARR